MPDRVFEPKSQEHKDELHSHGVNCPCYPGADPSGVHRTKGTENIDMDAIKPPNKCIFLVLLRNAMKGW